MPNGIVIIEMIRLIRTQYFSFAMLDGEIIACHTPVGEREKSMAHETTRHLWWALLALRIWGACPSGVLQFSGFITTTLIGA